MKTPTKRRRSPRQNPRELYEYLLLLTRLYNNRKKRIVTRMMVRTVKEFSHFRYILDVDARVEGRSITVDIQGLRAPEFTVPDVGPATFETEFDNLEGVYDVMVRKLGKERNLFRINVAPEHVVVEQSPEQRFVNLITQLEHW